MDHEGTAEEFETFVRDHHVHFDVDPEVTFRDGHRLKIGFEVRLWAVHPKGAGALPGCSKCHDLVGGLRRIAECVIPGERRPTQIEFEPFHPVLYDSREVAGADEVAVTLRLAHRDGSERPADDCQERCLKEIRQRLRAMGIRER
jgi:hypothetical protein